MRMKGQWINWHLFLERCSKGHPNIEIDPAVIDGMPRLTGSLIPITLILARVRAFGDFQHVTENLPEISREQIEEALSNAETFLEVAFEQNREAGSNL